MFRMTCLPLLAILAVALLSYCGGADAPSESPPAEPAEAPEIEQPAAPAPETEPEPQARAEPEPAPPAPAGPPRVRMSTDQGDLVLELYPDRAPQTVENFLEYVDANFYDGTIFHRVIPGFMIQGGGFTSDMQEKSTRPPIQNEAGNLSNTRYTIAMARTSAPHSATAQFFINQVTNRALDKDMSRDGWGYCAFGKVVEGASVIESIAGVQTGNRGGHQNVPQTPIIIQSVRREG